MTDTAEQLRNHLAGRHGAVMSVDTPYDELVEHHAYEHTGPCGIRNHDIDDLDYDPAKADAAYAEVADQVDGEELEWIERSGRVTLERVAVAAAIGADNDLTITAEPADGDVTDDEVARRFYVDASELTHGPGGLVTGVRRVRWELTLTRVGVLDDGAPT